MEFTKRGEVALLLSAVLTFSSTLFRDVLLGAAALLVFLVIAAEAISVRLVLRKPESRFALVRDNGDQNGTSKKILYPGDESVERITLRKSASGGLDLHPKVPFLSVRPSSFDGRGNFSVDVQFSTPYSGEYAADRMPLAVTGPLGLFSSFGSIPLRQEFVVYPRLLQVATATVRLLGKGEIGETPIEMPGVGTEYYEMREYHPGDDFRNVNWKATAREGGLIVIEHMREVGASYLLVLDSQAAGFADSDRLASTFLLLANSLASAGVSFGVLVHDGSRIRAVSPDDNPRSSLEVALRAAVSAAKLDAAPEFLELVPRRQTGSSVLEEGQVPESSGLRQIPLLLVEQLRGILEEQDPWSTASRYIREGPTKNVLYVSGMVRRPEPVLELAWQARHYRDVSFSVLDPTQPGGEDQDQGAFRIRRSKLSKAFASSGVSYYVGEPQALVRRALSV